MNEVWLWVGLITAFEIFVFVVSVFLPFSGLIDTDFFGANVSVAKWFFLAAAAAHTIALLLTAFKLRKTRSVYFWHFGLGIWMWAWPTIAAFVWHSTYGTEFPTLEMPYDAENVKSFILWKTVLVLAAVAATATMVSVTVLVRERFALDRMYSRLKT